MVGQGGRPVKKDFPYSPNGLPAWVGLGAAFFFRRYGADSTDIWLLERMLGYIGARRFVASAWRNGRDPAVAKVRGRRRRSAAIVCLGPAQAVSSRPR